MEAPKDSGTLAKSFTSTISTTQDTITYRLPEYAEYVINGSAPHKIKVKNKKILAVPRNKWQGDTPNPYGSKDGFPMLSKDGKFVLLGRQVNHPGNAPNPFMEDVLHRRLRDLMKQALNISQR